ncbi:MAG: prepilin-type N-terminal cleavage/methylation domain-containing protein [bacterium]|nr:prepilin-type N-terminal cleavage/methylation domain-containing protein [bacterium]
MKTKTQTTAVSGFTMGEMVIVIAIIAILAALIAPLAVSQITQARYDTCREELEIIKQAIAGDPTLIEGGVRSSYGFVGDLGIIPATLQELVTNPGYPTWQQPAGSPIWLGWRGPYVSEINDPWGRNYSFLVRAATATDYTRIALWSLGPDGVDGSSDDITGAGDGNYGDDSAIKRIYQDELFSTISGNVIDPCGAQAPCSVAEPTNITISYPNGTAVIQTIVIPLTAGVPIIDNATPVPIGIRHIAATIQYTDSLGSQTGTVSRFIYINNGPITSVNLRPSGACN